MMHEMVYFIQALWSKDHAAFTYNLGTKMKGGHREESVTGESLLLVSIFREIINVETGKEACSKIIILAIRHRVGSLVIGISSIF